MADNYKLSFTAEEINERLRKAGDALPLIEIHPEIDDITESGYVGRISVTESAMLAKAAVQKLPVVARFVILGIPSGAYVLNLVTSNEEIIWYEFESVQYMMAENVHAVMKISSPQGILEGEWAFAVEISTPTDSLGDAILYKPQSLTPEQQAQARGNIGAVTVEDVLAALTNAEEVAF